MQNEFTIDGFSYAYSALESMGCITYRVVDCNNVLVGELTIDHNIENAFVSRSTYDHENVNYWEFSKMEPLAVVQWVVSTSY